MPWTEKPEREALYIDVSYDRTRLAQDGIATVTANIRNNLPKTANMVMIDLGIPPGFRSHQPQGDQSDASDVI